MTPSFRESLPPRTLTTLVLSATDAARMVGVKPNTLRQWVARGYLQPVAQRRVGRSLVNYYLAEDVRRVERERRTPAHEDALRTLGAEFLASLQRPDTP